MKVKLKKLIQLVCAIVVASVIFTLAASVNIYAEAENYYLYKDKTSDSIYLCYRNSPDIYQINDKYVDCDVYLQLDWNTGKDPVNGWNYIPEWDDPIYYGNLYHIESINTTGLVGCVKIDPIDLGVINEEEISRYRIRFLVLGELISTATESLEITDWSSDIVIDDLKVYNISDKVSSPTICSCDKDGSLYRLTVSNSDDFFYLYGIPENSVATYIEYKTKDGDWTNIVSYIPINETDEIIVEIDEDVSMFRCKYGVKTNGEVINSSWSDPLVLQGTKLNDSEIVVSDDSDWENIYEQKTMDESETQNQDIEGTDANGLPTWFDNLLIFIVFIFISIAIVHMWEK